MIEPRTQMFSKCVCVCVCVSAASGSEPDLFSDEAADLRPIQCQ